MFHSVRPFPYSFALFDDLRFQTSPRGHPERNTVLIPPTAILLSQNFDFGLRPALRMTGRCAVEWISRTEHFIFQGYRTSLLYNAPIAIAIHSRLYFSQLSVESYNVIISFPIFFVNRKEKIEEQLLTYAKNYAILSS